MAQMKEGRCANYSKLINQLLFHCESLCSFLASTVSVLYLEVTVPLALIGCSLVNRTSGITSHSSAETE